MNILRLTILSLTLAMAVITLSYVTPAFANKPDGNGNHNHGGGDGGGKNECKMSFDVVFRDDPIDDVVVSDGDGVYPNPATKDKTFAIGGGGGFRFDTNGNSQKINGAGGTRELRFLHVPVPGSPDFSSGVDLRFQRNVPRLELCSLDKNDVGTIPVTLAFADNNGDEWLLLYDCIFHSGDTILRPDGSPASPNSVPVDVTRTRQQVPADPWTAGDTWTIEGTTACLISATNWATGTPLLAVSDIPALFEMTITAQ